MLESVQIVRCLAKRRKRMCCFAGNSLLCQTNTFEVLTPTSTYHQFFEMSYKARFCFQIYPVILLAMLMGFFKSWEFHHTHLCAGNKQSIHIISLPAEHTRSRPSAGHTRKCI